MSAEFAINNKAHSTTKVSLRRKGKIEKAIEFAE